MFRGVPAIDRFYLQTEVSDECWLWKGGKDSDGYGSMRSEVDGVKFDRAHRFSYAYFNGPIAKGLCVCHSCDNPSCVNPEHLFLGTHMDNQRDMIAKGRQNTPFGEQLPQTKLTVDQVVSILKDPRATTLIAFDMRISRSSVRRIKTGVDWKQIDEEPVDSVRPVSHRRGISVTLNEDRVKEIRASEEPYSVLAARFSVSIPTICDIRKRKSWKHVT
jgi:hypothetical protein